MIFLHVLVVATLRRKQPRLERPCGEDPPTQTCKVVMPVDSRQATTPPSKNLFKCTGLLDCVILKQVLEEDRPPVFSFPTNISKRDLHKVVIFLLVPIQEEEEEYEIWAVLALLDSGATLSTISENLAKIMPHEVLEGMPPVQVQTGEAEFRCRGG